MTETAVMLYPKKAVWKGRKYHRHSVERDVKHFIGWPAMQKLLDCAETQEERDLVAFTFESGGRISEVLGLKPSMFTVIEAEPAPVLVVRDMPLRKKYRKVSEHMECLRCHHWNAKGIVTCETCGENLLANGRKRFRTELLKETRNEFVIRTDDSLCKQVVLPTLDSCRQKGLGYVFLNPYTGRVRDRRWAYKALRKLGDRAGLYLYPHRLRSERACELGQSLKAESLLEWFTWEHWSTAKRYSKQGALGLAKQMGVQIRQ